jgi:hypothetical protein
VAGYRHAFMEEEEGGKCFGIYIYIYIYIYKYMYVYIHIYTNVHIYINIYVYIHIYIYIYTYIYIYIYLYMNTHKGISIFPYMNPGDCGGAEETEDPRPEPHGRAG